MRIYLSRKNLRRYVQTSFLFYSLYIWYMLYLFVKHFDSGGASPYVPYPESVDAFMPLGALVALKNLVVNRVFDKIHPASLVILISILIISLLYRRGFCGWICPVGTVSEAISNLGIKIFGRNFRIPGFLDLFMRSIKYLLLLFFLKIVVIDMNSASLMAFLQSPYYKVVAAKLLDFWINPGRLTLIFTTAIVILSLIYRNFWCRYLCPYGALLGILGFSGVSSVKRKPEKCSDCRICTEVCSANIQIHTKNSVRSPECMACFNCIESCPNKALSFSIFGRSLNKTNFAVLLLGTFFLIIVLARLTNHWNSGIPYSEYKYLIPVRDMISH